MSEELKAAAERILEWKKTRSAVRCECGKCPVCSHANRHKAAELLAEHYLSPPAAGPGLDAAVIVRRLVKWNDDYPKGMIHPFRAEKVLDEIVADAKAIGMSLPPALTNKETTSE